MLVNMAKRNDRAGKAMPEGNAALEQLTARLSVAIGKPAQSILALADDVLDTALSTLQREQVRHIRMAADTLLTVVNDLGDYGKLEKSQFALLETPFSLRDHVAQVTGHRVRSSREKGVILRAEIDNDVPD